MFHLTLNVLLQTAAFAGASHDYATAFRQTEESGRPLVVLIGADWCPGCRQMKYTTIPELEKKGELRNVALAYVNTDRQGELAGKLMRGSSIPQLVMYRKTEAGWMRKQLTGAQSTSSIESFIAAATDPPTQQVSRRD
jgi:thioredoxin-like negative regulator of GroEL